MEQTKSLRVVLPALLVALAAWAFWFVWLEGNGWSRVLDGRGGLVRMVGMRPGD